MGVGSGVGEQDDEELIAVGADEYLAEQVEHADFGVDDSFAAGSADGDVVVSPQRAEVAACAVSCLTSSTTSGSPWRRAAVARRSATCVRKWVAQSSMGNLSRVAGSVNQRQMR